MKTVIKKSTIVLLLALPFIIWSCEEDPAPVVEPPIAGFSFEIDTENTLKVVFTNTSIDADSYVWDFGDGNTSVEANPTHTFTASDTYTVKLTATNTGGDDELTQDITVSGFGPNLVMNGDMASDEGWTLTQLWTNPDNVMKHRFDGGVFVFESGDDGAGTEYRYSQYMLYTAVPVEAGKTYQFSADVAAISGTENTWFEIYLTTKAPESEGDIDPNGEPPVPAQLALKSFGEGEDCILSAFDGDIMEIAAQCTAANNFDQLISADGKITVAADNIGTDGNIYLVFKTGNWDGSFNDTMTLDNVVIKEII